MKALSLTLVLCTPLAAIAQSPMTGSEFETYTKGKTLIFSTIDGPYGGEEYLSRRRVLWSNLDGECLEGFWYTQGDMICFEYPDEPGQQCWQFFESQTGLRAEFATESDGFTLIETSISDDPLYCKGPLVGS